MTPAHPLGAPEPELAGGFGATLALTVTLAVSAFLVLMAALLLVLHPTLTGLQPYAGLVNQQNQGAKTALYLLAFLAALPLSLLGARRLSRPIAAGPNAAGLPALAGVLAASLTALVILIRLSSGLPWGDGLGTVLGAVALWSALAGAGLRRACAPRPWPVLLQLEPRSPAIALAAGALLLGALLCVTPVRAVSVPALGLGAVIAAGAVLALGRVGVPRLSRWPGAAIDGLIVVLLLLAIPDLAGFHTAAGAPNIYFEPGIIQYQQDFLLGSANQLLSGGALLVNVPVSQYGVGSIYFIAGWFHLVPIGYGMFALLDSLLTALFFVAGYCVLRLAGVGRLLAGSAFAVAVVVLVYNLHFAVGELPEQGPLRFGPPMAVVLATVLAAALPRYRSAARIASLAALGVSSIWAVEAFGYTAFAFAGVAALEAWLSLGEPRARRRALGRALGLGVGAGVIAQLMFAGATLIGTGQLPHWGQYLAYVHELLLGGKAGAVSYGFARFSPALAIGAADLASAAAVVLLMQRAPGLARRERALVIAIGGSTAYAVALCSYTDNRSSTYLLPYVSLPILMAGVLWLTLLLRSRPEVSLLTRRAGLGLALAVVVLMVGAAWPSVDRRFSDTALAHAYPGGGLRAALHALKHPPPIDPRAPEGERLLARYMPARRVLILLPTVPDLGTEILIRSRRANSLFIGDPKADSLVPSVWLPKLTRAVAQLRPGTRVLTDRTGLAMAARFAGDPGLDPLQHELQGGSQEPEWILRQLQRRFRMCPLYRDPDGLIVAELRLR